MKLFIFLPLLVVANVSANNPDLDDIKLYDFVKVEYCLDKAYDRIPGYARKLEFKIEGDDPIYKFDIDKVVRNTTLIMFFKS